MKLFTRTRKLGANLYCKFMVRGKAYLWCTKTNDPVTARRRARDYREAIISASYGVASKMLARSECITYKQVLDVYCTLPLKANADTRARCEASLKLVLAASGLTIESRLDTLAAKVGILYQQKGLKAGHSPVSINSNLRFARAVFSRAAMVGYKAMGLVIDRSWVDDFMEVQYLPEPEQRPEIPTPEQVEAAHALLTLPVTDSRLFKAYLLAAYAGLRAGEIAASRWDWIEGDVIYIGGRGFDAKSKRWRAVRLDPGILALLAPVPNSAAPILGDNPSWVLSKLNDVLQQAGFTSTKPIHSLRRLYGSKVAMASGLFAAQAALGHASPATTSKHYARMLTLPAAVGIAPPVSHEKASPASTGIPVVGDIAVAAAPIAASAACS